MILIISHVLLFSVDEKEASHEVEVVANILLAVFRLNDTSHTEYTREAVQWLRRNVGLRNTFQLTLVVKLAAVILGVS